MKHSGFLQNRLAALGCGALLALFASGSFAQDDGSVPKQVHLIVESSRLVASNVQFSRFDDLKLNARETVRQKYVGDAAIIVVTNQRFLAYGVTSGWRPLRRDASETVETISVEDYAGLVVTNRRFLNFNGRSGVWGERDRSVALR